MRTPYIARLKAMMQSRDPGDMAVVRAANAQLLKCKAVVGSLQQNQVLTNLSIQYHNDDFIGTRLMPVVSVPKLSGEWYVHNKRDRLSGPDDYVGSRSKANEITEHRSLDTYSCKPYALQNWISELDLQNQDAPLNEMADLTQSVNDVLDLKEELRIATIMTTAGNFPGQTAALTGADRWDVSTGDPQADINAALDSMWGGLGNAKTVAYMGVEVMRALQVHPKIVALFSGAGAGGISVTQVKSLFPEIDEFLVGRGRKDTANEGQAASYSRIWGKQFGIVKVAQTPSTRTVAFGFTLRFQGARTATQWFDQTVGTRGGYYAKVGFEEDHKIIASDTGYLYTTVLS